MDEDISQDYICYLEKKWIRHLRKNHDPSKEEKRRILEDVRESIDDMINQTEAGIMLYNFFYEQLLGAEGELKEYEAYLREKYKGKGP